jgi:isopenicillin N synthase-like dioxygenase
MIRPLRRGAGHAFEVYGFAVVRDHGIDADVIARAEAAARAFFALPEEVKRRYHLPAPAARAG